jgi:hypothetical protein
MPRCPVWLLAFGRSRSHPRCRRRRRIPIERGARLADRREVAVELQRKWGHEVKNLEELVERR